VQEPKTLLKYPERPSQISFPAFKTEGEKPKNPIEKFLSLFADVRAGEGLSALLLGLNVFLLLTGYLLLKTAREPLILTEGGAEVKTYASAGQAMLLLLAVPFYGWIGTRINRLKLVVGLDLFFAANLALFAALGRAGAHVGVVFYIWVGIFNVFVISQFWAFANDIYTEGQGRRLFPMIGVGSSLGAVAGARLAAVLSRNFGTPYELMLVCAMLLLVSIAIIIIVDRREVARGGAETAREAAEPLGAEGGFQLLWQDRYLFWIAVLTVLLNVVNTSGEYLLARLLQDQSILRYGEAAASLAQRQRFIAVFEGDYLTWTNLVGLLSQLFLVSRLIRHAGVRKCLFVLPSISLTAYSIIAIRPVLALIRVLKIAENSTDYSLQNTIRQALWLPTTREAKYKAKAAVDTFCTRMGDVLAAGLVFAVSSTGARLQAISSISVLLALVWLWVASRIAKEHRKRTV
jgi:ATP:ADP antiporter, AAA family